MSRWSLVLAGLLGLASMQARAADPLSVMSFNIRLPAESDGVDYWETRKPLAVRMLREQQPDVIGLQELVKAQADYLARELPQYAWFGRGREADGGGEHMGVFYRKDRLKVIESGDFWLSDTPDVAGSITWGHPHPRMVTWALFEQRSDGADRLSGLLIGTEIADATARFGQPRSLRLLRAGHLGELYEVALRERGFDVTADDAEQASRRGLSKAAVNIWGAQF